MTALMHILLLAVFSFSADFPRHFAPLTDSTRPLCTEDKLCQMTQEKNGKKYQILFDVASGKDESIVNTVKIVSLDTKSTEVFPLPVPKQVVSGDTTPLFAVDINNDGYNDVALQASLSNKFGYVFYYWVYNPKAKKFVFTKEMIPALLSTNGKTISSLTSHTEYQISSSFQIVEAKLKK